MSTAALATREGARLARASHARTLLIAGTIAGATALALSSPTAAWGCGALVFVVLAVARRSPRPERLEQVQAWSRAGANRAEIWAAGTMEALLLGWTATLVGATVGLTVLVAGSTALDWQPAYVLGQLGLVAVAACLPTRRAQRRASATRNVVERSLSIVIRVFLVALLLAQAFAVAASIESGWTLALGGALIVASVTLVGLVVSGPLAEGLVRVLARLRPFQPVGAIAIRYRTPGTVRLVIAAAVVVATGVAVLGASVEARPETERLLDERLAQLPVLPPNVALVRLELEQSPLFGGDRNAARAELSPQVRAAIASAVPGADVIELHHLEAQTFALFCRDCGHAVVVAEPRLHKIYGSGPIYAAPGIVPLAPVSVSFDLQGHTRFPPRETLLHAVNDGTPLPAASFNNAVYDEVTAETVLRAGIETHVQSVFLEAPRALTNADILRLAAIVKDASAPSGTRLTFTAPTGQIVPPGGGGGELHRSLRDQPWSATSASWRWSAALIGGLLALAALLATLAIDTLDRRRDVQRLERIGATPTQVRGAAALHAGVLMAVVAWSSIIVMSLIVRSGTRAFNHGHPEIPIPFVMPWGVVLFLAIGLPLIGAGLAALVARPAKAGTVDGDDSAATGGSGAWSRPKG